MCAGVTACHGESLHESKMQSRCGCSQNCAACPGPKLAQGDVCSGCHRTSSEERPKEAKKSVDMHDCELTDFDLNEFVDTYWHLRHGA